MQLCGNFLLGKFAMRRTDLSFEMMAEPQRDITAERAAALLCACSATHYLSK